MELNNMHYMRTKKTARQNIEFATDILIHNSSSLLLQSHNIIS